MSIILRLVVIIRHDKYLIDKEKGGSVSMGANQCTHAVLTLVYPLIFLGIGHRRMVTIRRNKCNNRSKQIKKVGKMTS